MGRRAIKKIPKTLRGTYSDWNTAARTVKRDELETIATVCNTTVELLARSKRGVQSTGHYNDDGAATTDERASESTPVDSGTSNTTV